MQLNTNQTPATCDAVRRLLEDWRTRGGTLAWGTGAQASCFPILEAPDGTECWPWTLKPTSGTLEVVFQHLLGRPPSTTREYGTSYGSESTASPVSISRCHGWNSAPRSHSLGSPPTRA